MKASEALIAWTPAGDWVADKATAGKVKVGPLLGKNDPDWTSGYLMTGGAAYSKIRDAKDWEAVAMVFIAFHSMVVRDGIDPKIAHEAFLTIDEYRHKIAGDIPGAEELDGSKPDPWSM